MIRYRVQAEITLVGVSGTLRHDREEQVWKETIPDNQTDFETEEEAIEFALQERELLDRHYTVRMFCLPYQDRAADIEGVLAPLGGDTLMHELPDQCLASGGEVDAALSMAGYDESPKVLFEAWHAWDWTVDELAAWLINPIGAYEIHPRDDHHE